MVVWCLLSRLLVVLVFAWGDFGNGFCVCWFSRDFGLFAWWLANSFGGLVNGFDCNPGIIPVEHPNTLSSP